jgi:hypothetical protein
VTSSFGRSRSAVFCGVSTALLLLLAGCDSDENKSDQLARIHAKVDGVGRCAALLTGGWPIEASADALSGPRVDALVAAGLIRRVPLDVPEGERPRTRIDVTPLGEADVLIDRPSPKIHPEYQEPLLCYGRRQVTSVYVKKVQAAETGDPTITNSVLHYDYRIVQPPAWASRTDIRAAFPFMVMDLEQVHSDHEFADIHLQPETGKYFSP